MRYGARVELKVTFYGTFEANEQRELHEKLQGICEHVECDISASDQEYLGVEIGTSTQTLVIAEAIDERGNVYLMHHQTMRQP